MMELSPGKVPKGRGGARGDLLLLAVTGGALLPTPEEERRQQHPHKFPQEPKAAAVVLPWPTQCQDDASSDGPFHVRSPIFSVALSPYARRRIAANNSNGSRVRTTCTPHE